MKTDRLTFELENALMGLLDDTSPRVRRAILLLLQKEPRAGAGFLKSLVAGKNRVLAWHARWYLEELKFTDPVAEFKGFIRSLSYELETGTFLLSRTVSPDMEVGDCCTLLDTMADRCRELIVEPMAIREKCRVINRVIFHEYGFRGNHEHYTDPLNSLIDQVIARRKGIPITLSIVYLLVAYRLGLSLEPVGLPGHVVVGCYVEETPFFIDAFEHGAFRSAEDLFLILRSNHIIPKVTDLAPTPVREVLCRCCRNLIHHYRAAGDDEHARLFAEFVEEFDLTYERHTT